MTPTSLDTDVIGLNVTAVRVGFSSESRAVLLASHQCALMILAAQVGLYLVARARPRRLFWLGFTTSGLLAALSLVAGPPAILSPWGHSYSWQQGLFDRSPEVLQFIAAHQVLHSLVSVFFYFAPQFVVAVAGGLLAVGIGRILLGRRPGRSARSTSNEAMQRTPLRGAADLWR